MKDAIIKFISNLKYFNDQDLTKALLEAKTQPVS